MIHPSVKFWRRDLSNISENCDIGEGTIVHSGNTIMDGVKVGKRCKLEGGGYYPPGLVIGDDVFVGPGVIFTNDPTMVDKEWKPVSTNVENRVCIGAGAMIRSGLTIFEDAIVGMGSVVLKDIPSNEVWVGNPARYLRTRT